MAIQINPRCSTTVQKPHMISSPPVSSTPAQTTGLLVPGPSLRPSHLLPPWLASRPLSQLNSYLLGWLPAGGPFPTRLFSVVPCGCLQGSQHNPFCFLNCFSDLSSVSVTRNLVCLTSLQTFQDAWHIVDAVSAKQLTP